MPLLNVKALDLDLEVLLRSVLEGDRYETALDRRPVTQSSNVRTEVVGNNHVSIKRHRGDSCPKTRDAAPDPVQHDKSRATAKHIRSSGQAQ